MTTKVSTNQNAENQLPRRSASHSENVTDPTNQNSSSLKTSFLRRFNRLSAKTRTKYRNELRRSNSLLDLRTNQRSRSESTDRTSRIRDDSMRMRIDQSEGGTGLQDWIGRRLRNRGSTNQRAQSHSEASSPIGPSTTNQKGQTLPALNSGCTYVGNTLLKQKPRLRVRQSANQKSENIFSSANQDADNTSQDTLSIEDRILDYDPRRGRSNSCSRSGNSGPRGGTSGSELSDMEQVLFRAARLRSRRVRSASNETRGTDRTSQEWLKSMISSLAPYYIFFIGTLVFVNVKIQWNQILKKFDQRYFRESFYETNVYIFEVFLRFLYLMPKIAFETLPNFPQFLKFNYFFVEIDHLKTQIICRYLLWTPI